MENRLKERLTGAAILVALIVLLVPEMFHGQRSDVAASAGSSGEGPPVRSYTIDLSNGPARTAPLQSTPATSASNAAGEATAQPAPPAQPAQPAQPATPAMHATHADTALSEAAKPSPTASAPGNAAASAHAGAAGWSVQLGLFAQRDNAERLMHSAQTKGFAVNVSDRDAKGLYHVHAAGLADRAAAQALQQRLRDQGFAAAVVAPQPGGLKAQ
jgi:cell division septation protein DedD